MRRYITFQQTSSRFYLYSHLHANSVMDCTEAWVIEHNSDGPLFQCPWFLKYIPIRFFHIQKCFHYRALSLEPNQPALRWIAQYTYWLKRYLVQRFIIHNKIYDTFKLYCSLRVYRDLICNAICKLQSHWFATK